MSIPKWKNEKMEEAGKPNTVKPLPSFQKNVGMKANESLESQNPQEQHTKNLITSDLNSRLYHG